MPVTPILRSYAVWLVGHEEHVSIVHHVSAAKARYEYLLGVGDVFPDGLPWELVRSRSLGPFRPEAHRDEQLTAIAEVRARPDLVLGATVREPWDGKVGTIVAGDGGYVAVIFAGERYTSLCHPGELEVAHG